jgi:2'-5' RNA ligase
MRYILALLPPKESVLTYIQAAQMLFSPCSDGYLLREQIAQPHVTLCQFKCDLEECAKIWEEFSELEVKPIPLRFTGVRFGKGSGIHEEFYWTELSVARDAELMRIHRLALSIVQAHGHTCLTDCEDLYNPHLTLARIRLPKQILSWQDALLNNPGPFKIALGEGDDNGQYIYTLFDKN